MEKSTKFNRLELKDFEEAKGIVTFYYSVFNNVDQNGDIVSPFAFNKTIQEQKDYIYHNRDHCESVGAPLEFGVDQKGAFVVSQLGIKTIDGADCFEQYKAKMIKGHSMEWRTVKSSYDETKEVRTLLECQLWGVTSITAIPANLLAGTISIKSYENISESISEIERFLRNGNISDEMGKKYVLQIKELNDLAQTLEKKAVIDTLPIKPIVDFNYLKQNLTI